MTQTVILAIFDEASNDRIVVNHVLFSNCMSLSCARKTLTLDSLPLDIRKYIRIEKAISPDNEKEHCFIQTNGVKLTASFQYNNIIVRISRNVIAQYDF